jgi:ribosomal protein S18 acetylase RimI-like enzyme
VLPLRYSQRFYQDLLQNPQLAMLCRVATTVGTATTTNDADNGQQKKVVGALCVAWNDANSTKKKMIQRNQSKDNTNGDGTDGATMISVDGEANNYDDDDAAAAGELWIMTLAVLAPYRSQGIGGRLLQSLLQLTALQQQHMGGSSSTCTGGGARSRRNNIAQIRLHVQTSNEDAIRFYTKRFGFVHDGTILTNYYPRLDPPDCYVLSKPVLVLPRVNYINDPNNGGVHDDDSNPDTTTAKQVVTSPDPDPNNKKRKLPRDDEEASTSSSSTTPSSLSSSHGTTSEVVIRIPHDVSGVVPM